MDSIKEIYTFNTNYQLQNTISMTVPYNIGPKVWLKQGEGDI